VSTDEGSAQTVIAVPTRDRVLIVGGLTVLGIVLGVAAPVVIRWLHDQGLPFPGPLHLVELLATRIGSWILPIVGAVVGLVLGAGVAEELASVRITGRDVTFIRGKKKQRFARGQISAALIDDGHLVLRDERDADLIREKLDVPVEQVATALRAHDWPIAEE
jgi:hypothetical protein